MRKIFTFAIAAIFSASMLADQAFISWQLGANGGEASEGTSIVGQAGSLAEGWTISMTNPDASKKFQAGGKVKYNGKDYKTIKTSAGSDVTVQLPAGLYASKVEFLAVTNDQATAGKIENFNNDESSEEVLSLKDFANPTVIVKSLAAPAGEFTFSIKTKQVCWAAIVTYTDNANPNCEDPMISFGNWSEANEGFEVTISSNEAGVTLSYAVNDGDWMPYAGAFYVGSKAAVSAKASKEGYNDAIVSETAPLHVVELDLASDTLTFAKDDSVFYGLHFVAPHITLEIADDTWKPAANDSLSPEGFKAGISGTTNPSPGKGAIPTSGCFYTFKPAADGLLKVAIKAGSGKKFYALDEDATKLNVIADGNLVKGRSVVEAVAAKELKSDNLVSTLSETEFDSFYGILSLEAAKDKTYYIYLDGSKMSFAGFIFVTEEVTPEEGIENTSIAPKASKRIENGQIVIIKNGVKYNALGTQVK